AAEWEEFFHERGIPAERVRTIREALQIGDTEERRLTALLDPLESGERLHVPAMPFRFSKDGPEITRRPPAMGEHNHEILRELGFTMSDIQNLERDGVV